MGKLLTELCMSIISSVDSSINFLFDNLIDTCFNSEDNLTMILNLKVLDFSALKTIILSFAISLIILKTLKKGIETYIAWSDGDSDMPVSTVIIYFFRSIITAISFPFVYELFVTIIKEFATSIMTTLNGAEQSGLLEWLKMMSGIGSFNAMIGITILILMLVIYIQLIMRGIEMFILKVGFPMACIGLLDSDKGVFVPYTKKFIQNALTVIIQIALAKITILLVSSNQMINAVAMLFVALKTPRFLNEFMLQVGNPAQAVSSAIHTVSKSIELVRQIRK